MTPEEYLTKKIVYIMTYINGNMMETQDRINQALKDTFNYALEQAKGVLPELPNIHEWNWAEGFNDCLEQSKSAISNLRIK